MFTMTNRSLSAIVLCAWLVGAGATSSASDGGTSASSVLPLSRNVLLDSSGAVQLQSIRNAELQQTNKRPSFVAVISSPDTPAILPTSVSIGEGDNASLSLSLESYGSDSTSGPVALLHCRGATLQGTPLADRTALSTVALLANVCVLDGITVGDIGPTTRSGSNASGFTNSRHAQTLTALFRARLLTPNAGRADVANGTVTPMKLLLVVQIKDKALDSESINTELLHQQIQSLYQVVATEAKSSVLFDEAFTLDVAMANSPEEAPEILAKAYDAAVLAGPSPALQPNTENPLTAAMLEITSTLQESGVPGMGLDTPALAAAFCTVSSAAAKYTKRVLAQLASWKGRTARGLLVDAFGSQALQLRESTLKSFDHETRSVAGLANVSPYRKEVREKLQKLLDNSIPVIYAQQVDNLQAAALARLQAKLLAIAKSAVTPEQIVEANAQALRQERLTVETLLAELEIPELFGLSQEKALRDLTAKLADFVQAFPDSPAAKIQRTSAVNNVVNKQRKPTKRRRPGPAIDLGVDLVAMLRPDGFGNLQGYAGYQLGGNSITFGVHNDADDPQTIAQFGGVRPPLLRVQPKLRVDLEF